MANPKSIREQLSDLTTLTQTLQTTLHTNQIRHNGEVLHYQQTIQDLVRDQEDLKRRNISLETMQNEMLTDLKLLKRAVLRDATPVSNSIPDPTALGYLRRDLNLVKDRISSMEGKIRKQRDVPRDLADLRADLQRATQDITTLQAGSHSHHLEFEDLEAVSRSPLSHDGSTHSHLDADRGHLHNYHEALQRDTTRHGNP
jgi:chromosome segregation ATPase